MKDFTPSLDFRMQRRAGLSAMGSCSETLKIQLKPSLFHDNYKPQKAPYETKCFLFADLPLKEIRNGINRTLLRGGDGGATRGFQQSRWVQQTGNTAEVWSYGKVFSHVLIGHKQTVIHSSADLLYHRDHRKSFSCHYRPPRWNHISMLQSNGFLPETDGRAMSGLWNNLQSCTENHVGNTLMCFPKNIVYSWQSIWKGKSFYFSGNCLLWGGKAWRGQMCKWPQNL